MSEPIRLSDKASRELAEQQTADDRVWQIMDIICAEWQTDPISVQCFDLRLVEEAIALVKKRKAMKDPFNPFHPWPTHKLSPGKDERQPSEQPETGEWIIQRCTQQWIGTELQYQDWGIYGPGTMTPFLTKSEMMERLEAIEKRWPDDEFRGHNVKNCRCHAKPAGKDEPRP